MIVMGDVITDVMQQRRGGQHRALMSSEIGRARTAEVIENSFPNPGDLLRVGFFISEATAYGVNSAETVIGDVRQRRMRLSFDFAQSIDKHAFAQGPITRAQGFNPESAHNPFKDLSSANNDF